jgi:hypothetical protein
MGEIGQRRISAQTIHFASLLGQIPPPPGRVAFVAIVAALPRFARASGKYPVGGSGIPVQSARLGFPCHIGGNGWQLLEGTLSFQGCPGTAPTRPKHCLPAEAALPSFSIFS